MAFSSYLSKYADKLLKGENQSKAKKATIHHDSHRSLTLIFFLYLYIFYVVKGRTVASLLHKLFLGELHRYYSGYNLVRIPFE